jgi:hypothetical protein
MTDLDRNLIRRAVGGVLFNVSNFPERAQSSLWGANMGPLNERITDAVLAAIPAPEPSADALAVARNIVNQIGDFWAERIPSAEWVPVQQQTNDELDAFAARLIRGVQAKTLREAAEALEGSSAALDPSRAVDLAYINCTRIDARELRHRADRIEKGQTDE